MLRLFAHSTFDFLRVRRIAYVLTALLVIPGLLYLAFEPLNESIEFTGGTLIQLHANASTIRTGAIRQALDRAGLEGAEIQTFGAPDEFVVRARLGSQADTTRSSTEQTGAAVDSALTTAFGAGSYEIERTEAVGPKVGSELRQKALMAIFLSFGATLVYLWFRFEWRFGIAAILATAHDTIASVAFLSLMRLEITLVIVAAVLTIVGYSLNDTIVVFDRVRENLHRFKRQNLYEVLNRSVNETLPRTLLTSGTTLLATLSLLFLGGEVIRGFALMMTFGIFVGTLSSIYIASPALLWIEKRWPGQDVRGAKALDAHGATVVS